MDEWKTKPFYRLTQSAENGKFCRKVKFEFTIYRLDAGFNVKIL